MSNVLHVDVVRRNDDDEDDNVWRITYFTIKYVPLSARNFCEFLRDCRRNSF